MRMDYPSGKQMKVRLEVLPIHYLMLKYWHQYANQEMKEFYWLPEVGETIDGLVRRNLTTLEILTIEECYYELRELIKNEYGQTIELSH